VRQIALPSGRIIGDNQPCFVVAEIGQNHNGDVYTATRIMKAAADAGADAIKLCKRHIPSELTREAYNAPYSGDNSFGRTYGEHREELELSPSEYRHLAERVRYNEWSFVLFATACDTRSVDDLESSLNPPLYKVASRDLDNLPLIEYIARLGKPIIMSTGMAREGDIERALDVVRAYHEQIVLMVCTSEYPTPNEHVGLWRIGEWGRRYGVLIGLSDHTPGIVAAQAGACLGACVVEKHLTLSRAMKGTDHAASLEPEGLERLVRNIRIQASMMRHSSLVECEAAVKKLGRSLVTTREIAAGEKLSEADVCLKSPGHGFHWNDRFQVIGKVARRALSEDVTIDESDVMEAACVPR
jgi:sialic acid synthase SpsE